MYDEREERKYGYERLVQEEGRGVIGLSGGHNLMIDYGPQNHAQSAQPTYVFSHFNISLCTY